jgi:cytochrome c oxidase cbb3-type subunit 3
MRTSRVAIALSLAGTVSLMAAFCEREERRLDDKSPPAAPHTVAEVRLQPGPAEITDTADGPFDHNAYGTAEGQTLFGQMNCTGCHANGGGSIGPALMDDKWIYGSSPSQIFASIAEGRANGMPSWKNRLTDRQIWELVAYVRSLSGLTPKGARPNRDDNMSIKPAPSQTPNAKPKNASSP